MSRTGMRQEKKRRMSKRKRQHILMIVAIILLTLASTSIFVSVVAMRMIEAGEEALKEEGRTILYNGKEYRYRNDIVNILCIGVAKDVSMDVLGEADRMGFADAVFLLSMDAQRNTMSILAIPRDTMTEITLVDEAGNEANEEKMQLTYQYAYSMTPEQGGKLMKTSVSKLLHGVPIQRYCAINLEAVPLLNDAVGGVEVQALEDIPFYGITEGETVLLEGDMALEYVQTRDTSVFGSSLKRVERQKQYIAAFISQAKKAIKKDLSLPLDLYKLLDENLDTDLSTEEITYLGTELVDISFDKEGMRQIPGEMKKGEFAEYHPDDKALKALVIDMFYEEVKDPNKSPDEE